MRIETDVLIVGGGPAGLAAAIELGTRGVRVLLVEQNDRGGMAPRAKTTNVRTRTHLRRWGIAGQLADEAPFGIDYPNYMIFMTRLSGHELARFADAFNAAPARNDLYPEHAQWVPQYRLEKVMLEKTKTLPDVDIRFGTTFVTTTQDADGIAATIKAGETQSSVRARYLIGADGAHSTVRDLIGATMEGTPGISHSYNIIFRAPGLSDAHGFGPAAIYWQIGKQGFSAIGPMDKGDKWFFMPGGAKPGYRLSNEEAQALIAERTGIDMPYEILSADFWTASDLIADRYSDGRILLAGDACHLHPPAGGYGMNMGVGDGVDLGWKIAAVLQGWGGPDLLATYERERRPVHRKVIDEAVANFQIYLAAPPAELEDDSEVGAAIRAKMGAKIQASKGREFHTLGTVLGLGYDGSPIIADEASPPPPHDNSVYTPTARAGYLAPHAWLGDGRSLYDLFGQGFTLLAAKNADPAQVVAVAAEAKALGVPLTVIRPDGVDVEALYEAPLALIRPDQHVAWRGSAWTHFLGQATGHTAMAALS